MFGTVRVLLFFTGCVSVSLGQSNGTRNAFGLKADDPLITFVQPDSSASASTVQDDQFPKRQLNLGGIAPFVSPLSPAVAPLSLSNAIGYTTSPFSLYSNAYEKPNCLGNPAGMYGSPTYNCQVYYICQTDGRLDAMPCGLGTKFNNYLGICDWPDKVDANCNPLFTDAYANNGLYQNQVNNGLYQNQLNNGLYQNQQYPNQYQSMSAAYRLQDLYPYSGLGASSFYQAPRFSSPALRRY